MYSENADNIFMHYNEHCHMHVTYYQIGNLQPYCNPSPLGKHCQTPPNSRDVAQQIWMLSKVF